MSKHITPEAAIRIVEFLPEYAQYFHDINFEWLQEYFRVEPYDRVVLGDPQLHIIDQGGYVFFALMENQVGGTCALLKHTEKKYELAKMGVTSRFRRRGAGRTLVRAAIEKATAIGANEIVLATSKLLTGANKLYLNNGFEYADESVIGPLPYERETVVMAMTLQEPA